MRVKKYGLEVLVLLFVVGVVRGSGRFPSGARYLIIAPDSYYDALLPLARWKTQKGMLAKIAKLSETGHTASEIRAYIQDAYNTWDPRPEYVFLVGNGDSIPFVTVSGVRSDCYYGNMDGDIYDEIIPGRFPAFNVSEVENYVNKVLNYEKDPYTGDMNWYLKATQIVEIDSDDDDSIYWGDVMHAESLMYKAGFTHVDMFSDTAGNSASDVYAAIEDGRSFINFRGQSVCHWWSPFTVDPYSTNPGLKLPVVVSPTCSQVSSNFTCGSEWVRAGTVSEPRGGIAFCGPTTVVIGGAYKRSALDRGFFDYVFTDTGDSIVAFGKGVEAGRKRYYDLYADYSEFYGFQCIADPELNIWTGAPESLVVQYPSAIPPGLYNLDVHVENTSGDTVPYALVCAMKDTAIYSYGYTDNDGDVTLTIETGPIDTVLITVTARNKIPYQGYTVATATGPYVAYLKEEINDSGGDGVVNPGETVDMTIWLKNYGDSPSHGVYAILSTDDPYISISVDSSYYGYLAPDDSSAGSNPYSYSVDLSAPDEHHVNFDLTVISSDGDTWISHPSVIVRKPILEYYDKIIDDPDSNHVPAPGEDIELYVLIENTGSAYAYNTHATLSMAPDPYVSITQDTASYGDIPPDSVSQSATPFEISIDSTCPDPYHVFLYITMHTGAFSYVDTFLLQIRGKGFFDDVESGEGDLTHGGSGDLWHITEHRSYSPTHSWYSGSEGSWQYNNDMNAWLMTPEIALYPESKLVFWTYYDLETNYDYGYVEVSTDGGSTWQQLGDALNGSSGGWVRLEYDLRSYTGAVLIRFRQTSDGIVTREGWYVDDISVEPWPYPDIEVSPLSFDVTLPPDTVDTLWMTISNVGEGPLLFTVRDTEWQVGEILLRKVVGDRTVIKRVRPHYEPAKGEPDPGRGVSPVKGQGGPDNYGYTWIDSDELGGPVYDWVEISGVGTPLNFGDDDSLTVSLPFTFNFYGEAKNSVKISSNGYLTFGIDGADYSNDPIPDPDDPNDYIGPFWDDLNPTQGGQVYYYYDEDNNRFIVEWKEVPHYYNSGSYTFEAILYPDGHMLYQYNTMDGDLTSATVGIENGDGSDGLEVVYNASYVHDGLAVWLGLNLGWLTEDPASGTVEVGESMDVGLVFNTADMDTGQYGAIVRVMSNDPQDSVVNVTISLHVTSFYPQISLSPQSIDTFAYAGDIVIDTITVQNTGDATLDFTVETDFIAVSSSSRGVSRNSVSQLAPKQDWIEVTPTSGSVPPSGQTYLQVTLDATSLSEGTYTANIHINSNDPENPTVDVPVTFEVYQLYPHIVVSPTEIDTFCDEGQIVYDTIAIGNTGEADLTFSVTTEEVAGLILSFSRVKISGRQDWLETTPSSGTVLPGETALVQVKLDASTLTADIYTAIIHINSNDTANPTVNVDVTFRVNSLNPEIVVTPQEIDTFGQVGDIVYDSLLIENEGEGTLYFNILATTNSSAEKSLKLTRTEALGSGAKQNWLEVIPEMGTVSPGGSAYVLVKMDATSLTAGTHTGNIFIYNNDTSNSVVEVPVSFTVYNDSILFIRGDANADGSVNVTDAVYFLSHLYPPDFTCEDAADFDDDGQLNTSDAIYFLQHFAPPNFPEPNGSCGPDPTADQLICGSFPPCGNRILKISKVMSAVDTLLIGKTVVLKHSRPLSAFQFEVWGTPDSLREMDVSNFFFFDFKKVGSGDYLVSGLKDLNPNSSAFSLSAGAVELFSFSDIDDVDSVSGFYVTPEGIEVYPVIYWNSSMASEDEAANKFGLRNIMLVPELNGVKIDYAVPQGEFYELAIYDVAGRCILSIDKVSNRSGKQVFVWKGRDSSGKVVSPGIYMVKLTYRESVDVRKILRLK